MGNVIPGEEGLGCLREVAKWCTLLVLSLGRQKQANLYELEASLVYKVSSKATSSDPGQKTARKPNERKGKDEGRNEEKKE